MMRQEPAFVIIEEPEEHIIEIKGMVFEQMVFGVLENHLGS